MISQWWQLCEEIATSEGISHEEAEELATWLRDSYGMSEEEMESALDEQLG